MRWVASGVVVVGMLVAGRAEATPPTKAQVRALLSGYEDVPGEATWRALGPETLGILVELYADAREEPFVRLRAITVSAHYPTPAARTFLTAVLSAPRQRDLFAREALLSLARAFGDRALPDITPHLASRDPVIREGATLALARLNTEAARTALRTRLPSEPTPHIRALIERTLR